MAWTMRCPLTVCSPKRVPANVGGYTHNGHRSKSPNCKEAFFPSVWRSPMLLENLSWPEVKKLKLARKVVVFPLGSFEQHGPHLPLTTDTDIVTAIPRRLEQN